jgi:DNA-binding transcriptional LysR family regulator
MGPAGGIAFDHPEGRQTVTFQTTLQSENETLLHLAALEGMGLVFLPMWMARTDIAQGRLELVLQDEAKFSTTLYAVYPSRKYLAAKVRTFIDFLASRADSA